MKRRLFSSKPIIKIDKINLFAKREIAEIPRLLMEGEKLLCATGGFYTAGTATLCVTTERVILIDKKITRLSYEDIRFPSINEINYSHQLIVASLNLYLPARKLQFRTWHKKELRQLSQIIEEKMFDARRVEDTTSFEGIVSNTKSITEPRGHMGLATLTGFLPQLHLWAPGRLDAITRLRRVGRFLTIKSMY